MHHNAQRATIGVRIRGVRVCHLRNGKQGQQNKTHQCPRRKRTVPCAADIPGASLESGKH
jgi:hypothetical protein